MFQPVLENVFVDKKIAVSHDTLLEAKISSKEDIVKVLSVSVNPEITSAEMLDGEALVNGRAAIRLIALSESGDIVGMNYNADFSERIKGELSPSSKMFWEAVPLEVKNELNSGIVKVSALLEIGGEGIEPQEVAVLTGGENMLVLPTEANFGRMVICEKTNAIIENEMEVKQNIARVLLADSYVCVKDYTVKENVLTFGGKATISLVYITDENQVVSKVFGFDFTQETPVNGFDDSFALSLKSRVNGTKIRMDVVEDLPTTSFTAEIDLSLLLCGYEMVTKTVAADAYSLTNELDVQTTQIKSVLPLGQYDFETEASANIAIDGALERFIAVTNVNAFVSKVSGGEGFAEVEGVVQGELLFEKEEKTDSASFQMPFTYTMKGEWLDGTVTPNVSVGVTDVSYKLDRQDAVVSARLTLSAGGFKEVSAMVVTNVALGGELSATDGAIEVVLAHKGDTLWNIGKWLHMRQEDILAVNPDMATPLTADAKIVVYHKL